MKLICNERGVTLLEVLAVTLIMTIVLGSGLLVMHALDGMMKSSNSQHERSSEQRETMHLLSIELTDSVTAFHPHPSELRYVRGDRTKKALVYTDSSLFLYTFTGTDEQFDHPDILFASSPHLYGNRRELTSKLKEPPKYTDQENRNVIWLAGGELLNIELIGNEKKMTLSLKLMKE